jgi:hypothetical protein
MGIVFIFHATTHIEVKLHFLLLPVRRQVERGIEGDDNIFYFGK